MLDMQLEPPDDTTAVTCWWGAVYAYMRWPHDAENRKIYMASIALMALHAVDGTETSARPEGVSQDLWRAAAGLARINLF